MEESSEDHNVVPELYFLIAKFLSGGPLKETAKTLLKELESVEVLPRRLDWEGGEHALSYDELASQYEDVSFSRLASVCERALRLARSAPAEGASDQGQRLTARLSLLSESLVRPLPKYASFKQDHSLVRRLVGREIGVHPAAIPGGRGGQAAFPPRTLSGLQLQRRTLGHLSAVYCLVFDCTGRIVITGADDLLVKVWSAFDGRLLTTLRGAGAEITDACVSADGALLACGSVERLVRVWCLATASPRAVLHAHGGTITSVSNCVVACGSVERLVRVWCLATGSPRAVLHAHGGTITSVSTCEVACGSVERLVRVWCLATASPRAVLHAHGGTHHFCEYL